MKVNKKETQEYKEKVNLFKKIVMIFLVMIFIVLSSAEIYLDTNNLKFISKDEKQALLDVLNLGEYTKTFEAESYKVIKNGFGSDDSYKVLEFIISSDDYKNNNLNNNDISIYTQNESIKVIDGNYYECTITVQKNNSIYDYETFIANSQINNIIRYVIAIILIIMFVVIIKLIKQIMYYTCKN